MLERLDAIRAYELQDLIRQSYDMVRANAPKSKSKSSRRKGSATATGTKTRNSNRKKGSKRA